MVGRQIDILQAWVRFPVSPFYLKANSIRDKVLGASVAYSERIYIILNRWHG